MSVPVTVKGNVPSQIAEDLEVIGCVCVEAKASWIGKGGQERGGHIEACLAELKKLRLRVDEGRTKILVVWGKTSLLVISILPSAPP